MPPAKHSANTSNSASGAAKSVTPDAAPSPGSRPTLTLRELVALVGGTPRLPGASRDDAVLTGVAGIENATAADVSFIASNHYLKQLRTSKAGAVLVSRKVQLPANVGNALVIVDDAELSFSKVLTHFAPPVPRPAAGVHPTAVVHPTARLGDGVAVGPHCFVGARTTIGPGTVLHANVYVGDDVAIGEQVELFPNVVIRERITVGKRVILHAGAVLGTDGFGYRWDGKRHAKVPQIGTVVIEDDVEIGSCACVDRAKFAETRVGRGTKIDNLVQVGHNVVIGPHCLVVGQVGLAGSARLGAGVVLGGGAAVRDHVLMGDGAMAAARSAVASDVKPGHVVSGTPALPHRQHLREQAALRRLPELLVLVRKLEEEIEQLKRAAEAR
jgi:UDP-3-O-[3-hydroxymyristoyl] glucosamine N-acyltransferase